MKKLFVLLIVLLLCLTAGCARTEEEKTEAPAVILQEAPAFDPSEYSIALCMDSYDHPLHKQVQLGFMETASELGYTDAQVIGTDLGDPLTAWETGLQFAEAGGDGIILWAGDHSCWETVKAMSDAGCIVGIPHFDHISQNDGKLPEGLSFNLGCSSETYGKQIAEEMAEALRGKEGKIAITLNTENPVESAADAAFRAAWAEKELPQITLLDTRLEGSDPEEAERHNAELLAYHPDIIGVFGTTSVSVRAWAGAAEACGRPAGSVWIAGLDAAEENLALLESGAAAAIVAQPYREEGRMSVELLDRLFRGESVEPWTELDALIVTKQGTGENSVEYHAAILKEVREYFE